MRFPHRMDRPSVQFNMHEVTRGTARGMADCSFPTYYRHAAPHSRQLLSPSPTSQPMCHSPVFSISMTTYRSWTATMNTLAPTQITPYASHVAPSCPTGPSP